jgi:hypothetical protein
MTKSKGTATPVDVYDKNGDMIKIEFIDLEGKHVVDAMWDENDEQTSENRIIFRKWAYHMLKNMGWKVAL